MKKLLLFLSLTVLIGCSQTPQMISTSFVEKNLSKLIEVEKARTTIEQQFKMAIKFVLPTEEQILALEFVTDLYRIYLEASYQHLAGGNLELYTQGIALAELQNEKFLNLIVELGKNSQMPLRESNI